MIPVLPIQRSSRSRVEIQNRVLTFEVPLLATPYSLHYRSDQVPGRIGPPALLIPLATKSPSKRLKEVVVEIDGAGEPVHKTFAPSVRVYRHRFEAIPTGATVARIRVGHVYRASFPMPELTKWREHTFDLRPSDARSVGLGGWTLNVHHRLDPRQKMVRLGDGNRRRFRSADLRRDAEGEISVEVGGGRRLLVFDEHGQHLRTVDLLTKATETEFTYGPSGELLAITDGAGNETRIDRRLDRGMMTLLGPAGDGIELRIDGNGYLSGLMTPGGQKTSFSHSDTGLLESVILPGGRRHAFSYDDGGAIIRRQEPTGTWELIEQEDHDRKTVALVDDAGRELITEREIAESGETVRTTRCCGGSEIKSITRVDGTEEITYPDGTRSVVEGSENDGTSIRMMKYFLPSRKTSDWKSTRTIEASGSGAKRRIRAWRDTLELNGRRFETVRDAEKRTITFTTPEGRKSVAEFDARGRLVRFSPWNAAPIERKWDGRGKLVEVAQRGGDERRVWKLAHDDHGRLSQVVDPIGRTTRLEFDLDDRLVREIAPAGEVAFLYSEDGAPRTLLTRAGQRFPLVRPSNRRNVKATYQRPDVVSSIQADGSSRSFAFAPGSNLVSKMRSSDGIDIDIRRDGSLITGITYSGRVEGKIGREFDRDLQLVGVDVNGSNRVEYRYDKDGLIIQAGRLSIERDPKTGRVGSKRIGALEITYEWSGFGDLRELRYTSGGTELFAISQRHDALGRVAERTERLGAAARDRKYAYDAAGRLASITSGGKTISRLAYDANGNRVAAEYEGKRIDSRYDSDDRILDAGDTRYEHTPEGSRSAAGSAGRVTRYEYDPLGPLRKVTLPDGMTVSYLLDALGRPCQKLVNGKPVQTFLFDQHFRVIAEVDGQNVRSRFVYGTRWHAPEYIETDGRTLFLISDELGTPRLVVDVANAAIVQRLDFDEFGMLLGDTSAAPRQPFGFAGGVHDADTGLTRFGARHYDARSGRWTQPDPLGYAAGTNLYEYVGGDPVNTIDPLGLSSSGETPSEGSTIEEIPTQPDYLPPETGRPVDNLNPPPKPFDIIDYIFNPKDPGPNPAGVPGRPPERGRYDFDVRNPFGGRNIRCFVSGQNRYPYGQEDGGGLGRDSYTGHPRGNNDYNTPLSTTGIGLGVSF